MLQEMPQCGLSMGCSSFRAYPSAPVQFSPDTTVWISSSVPGAPSHPFFFSFTSLHPGVFSCSLICSHGGATSTTVMLAVACVWVHYGAAWQNLSGTRQPLIFSHRGHPAALLLLTQCHLNSWESKQQQSITPELTCLAQTLIILKLFFMLGKRFRGVTDLLTCER